MRSRGSVRRSSTANSVVGDASSTTTYFEVDEPLREAAAEASVFARHAARLYDDTITLKNGVGFQPRISR